MEAARGIGATSPSTDPVPLQSENPPAQALQLHQPDEANSPEEPSSFHYKGLSLTPGGFLEGTMLVRTRNEKRRYREQLFSAQRTAASDADGTRLAH